MEKVPTVLPSFLKRRTRREGAVVPRRAICSGLRTGAWCVPPHRNRNIAERMILDQVEPLHPQCSEVLLVVALRSSLLGPVAASAVAAVVVGSLPNRSVGPLGISLGLPGVPAAS
jgi:hypothetical protein